MSDNILQFPAKIKEPTQRTGVDIKKHIKRNRADTKAYMDARGGNIERDKAYVDRAVDAIEDMMGSNYDLVRRVGIRLMKIANEQDRKDAGT